MVACRYGISLLVFNSTSHSFAALTRELSIQTLKRNSISTRAHVLFSITTMSDQGRISPDNVNQISAENNEKYKFGDN